MDIVFFVFIFKFAAFLFSVIIHEISHGYVAERLGDPTARMMGRLTLNPISHIDPFGSIILPALLAVTHSPIILGWAKPVPYDPRNLKNPKSGAGIIAAAGPLSNMGIAVIFGILLRLFAVSPTLVFAFSFIIFINVLLAVFNLVPLPPLDGSKVLFAFLPHGEAFHSIASFLGRYGFALLIIFIFFGFRYILPIVAYIYGLITGTPVSL